MNKLLVIIFFIAGSFAYGQLAFSKAYVVNLKGDTIRGEAQRNSKKPLLVYEKVIFKDEKGVQKNYKPEKLKAYGIDSLNYISLLNDGEPKFYKILAAGAINLYEISFEYEKGKEVLTESEYFLSNPDNKRLVLVKTAKFKKQLADWMKDDPDIAAKYDEEKEFDVVKATEVIKEFNAAKAEK